MQIKCSSKTTYQVAALHKQAMECRLIRFMAYAEMGNQETVTIVVIKKYESII